MSASTISAPAFAQSTGFALLFAPQALMKGALEAEADVALLCGPRHGAFEGVFRAALTPGLVPILREHVLRIVATPDAARAIALVRQRAMSERAGIALVPNALLDNAWLELARAATDALPRGGAACLILEDAPRDRSHACPRQAAMRADLTCIEVASVAGLRAGVDSALLISQTARRTVALVVHSSVLRSGDTLELHRNRASSLVEVLHARRRPRARGLATGDGGGALRAARRLDLNQFRAMPSPGERVATGFITVGPADGALMHLVNLFQLHGRVAILHLQMVHPLDEAAVGRMLSRCHHVVVLEPRPGVIETCVLSVAENLRRQGQQCAHVWGRTVAPDADGRSPIISSDDDLHPSVLVRKIFHLLDAIRPGAQITARLAPDPPVILPALLRRDPVADAGVIALRRVLNDLDQWLRERPADDGETHTPTVLAIGGVEPRGASGRVVMAETWSHQRFQREGPAAILQAARDDRPWLLLVCESRGEEIADLERLTRGLVPAERAERVRIVAANFNDPAGLRQVARDAALEDRVTVIVVQDGPPPQYDVIARTAALVETDQLGFEPRQRIVHSVDEVCDVRRRRVAGDPADAQARPEHLPRTEFTSEPVSDRVQARFRVRIRPLLEEVEVTRAKPPLLPWRHGAFERLPTPQPIHGRKPLWRAHIAGCRGDSPGALAIILCESGRAMGYRVRAEHDDTMLAPGMRAWAQVLFTNPRTGEAEAEIAPTIPYGEADLLLGVIVAETLRAIAGDAELRVAEASTTCAAVNLGDMDPIAEDVLLSEELSAAIAAVTAGNRSILHDFTAACRAWFDTDRLADVSLLGAAYQLGWVPLSPDAMESGLNAAEQRGYARSADAFEFGRRLALQPEAFRRDDEPADESISRLARRAALSFTPGFARSRAQRGDLAAVLEHGLDQMPGLTETASGRQALRDFVVACHHCMVWGGATWAQSYADLITRLYVVDRGDTGRALTRAAVLPLAEAMLIRDPLYVAGLVANGEHRLRVRRRLHAHHGRGDVIDRRYLTRFDVLLFNRRIRIDVRSSDWPARLADLARRFMPLRFRGTARERAVCDEVMAFVRRAIVESHRNYPWWADTMQRLHAQAAEDRVRGMAVAEIRMLCNVNGADQATESATAPTSSSP